MRNRSLLFQARLPEGFDLERDWGHIETMSRRDVAVRLEMIVPPDADLSRLIVYDTSGTTGHAIVVPFHPRSIARNHPLVEFVLDRYGVRPPFGPDMVCANVTARVKAVVFSQCFFGVEPDRVRQGELSCLGLEGYEPGPAFFLRTSIPFS